jgi:hypothetical protein
MGNDPKARSTAALDIPQSAAERVAEKPSVGDSVHFYDETQTSAFSRMGPGPYAAIVTRLDASGVSLFVMGPQGGRFDVEKVLHRSQLGEGGGKRRWWERPR